MKGWNTWVTPSWEELLQTIFFKKYPYKGEGFLTEMRSKMVNRQMLNDIAIKMGLKKITSFNKHDNSLKSSQILGMP